MRFFRSRTFTIIIAVLLAMTATLGLLHLSGFELKAPSEWFSGERNPNNLIKIDDSYIKTQDTNRGVEIKVADDGTIRLYGEATSKHAVTVATVSLTEAGTYCLSGIEDTDVNRFQMYALIGADVVTAGTDDDTFTIEEATTITIMLEWADEYRFTPVIGTKVQPVLVKGETPGDFYS